MTWLKVEEYAKRVGKSKAQIYLDIRLGKITKEKVRKGVTEIETTEIRFDE